MYTASQHRTMIVAEVGVPQGFMEFRVVGYVAYTIGKAREGSEWHNNGSKLIHHTPRGDYGRLLHDVRPPIIISRIPRLQTSYRAKLQPLAMLTELQNLGAH